MRSRLFILTRRQNRSNTMSDVQLLIKSPSYNEDFRLQLSLSATVKELKERIAQDHPSRPPAERQRLIFAGRLLQDTDVLKDILRLHDLSIPQTFHLVLKTEFTSGTNNNAPVTPPQQQPLYNQPFNQAPNPYLYQQRMQMHLGQVGGPYMMPGYAPQPGPNPYYNQYPPPGPYPGQYGPAYQQRVVVQGQVNPFQQMMMAQQQQQRRHVRVININLSLVFKLLLMVYVLSQGGTTQRTLFLAIGALFIYLYQTGLLPTRAVNIVPGVPQPPNNNVNNNVPDNNNNAPNNNNNNNNNNNDNNNNNNPVNNNNAVPNVANNNGPNNVNNAPTNPNQPVPYRQPPGLWGELHGFFVPFFYSLFPNWNPDDIHGVLQQHMHDQDEGENPAAQLNR